MVLLGDGLGNFRALDPNESGLVLKGDVRDFAWRQGGDQKTLIVGYNDGPLEVYKQR